MIRKYMTVVSCALALVFLAVGMQARADRVHFRYNGHKWSHTRHAGWHRYWGGPSIGFYYAPAPVYVVAGYSRASYYTGPTFWYSNPSFGLSINLGGGGHGPGPVHHDNHDRGDRSHDRGHDNGRDHDHGDRH
jgi:hypothetical protein